MADCPEARPDDMIRKAQKVKFSALVPKLSVDILEDLSTYE